MVGTGSPSCCTPDTGKSPYTLSPKHGYQGVISHDC